MKKKKLDIKRLIPYLRTNYIRYIRIVKHKIQYLCTGNVKYQYEVDHYYYMKSFTNI